MTPLNPSTPQPSGRDQMEIDGFVDSHAPIDFDPERGDGWPLPEPRVVLLAWKNDNSDWTSSQSISPADDPTKPRASIKERLLALFCGVSHE